LGEGAGWKVGAAVAGGVALDEPVAFDAGVVRPECVGVGAGAGEAALREVNPPPPVTPVVP
jgi:hypothetical protein